MPHTTKAIPVKFAHSWDLVVPSGTRVKKISDPGGGWVVCEFEWLGDMLNMATLAHDLKHRFIWIPAEFVTNEDQDQNPDNP